MVNVTAAALQLEDVSQQRGELAERLLRSAGGVFEIFTVYIGHRLGLYAALARMDDATPAELATSTGLQERYVREWLEQQAVIGILRVDDPSAPPSERRFWLPAGHAEVLAEPDSLDYLAPLAQLAVGATRPIHAVLEAFRFGGGVPYADYGADVRDGQAGMNRAMFLELLGSEWLPSIPDVHQRLSSARSARVADLGCGAGWSSIAMARAYPRILVDGFDLDEASVAQARANAWNAGLAGRVAFHVRDAAEATHRGGYDLVTAFECLHDMADPVGVLRTMRSLLNEHGVVLVVDERVGDDFLAADGDLDWMMYGWSVLHCLPAAMATPHSAATGTVMRTATLRRYAREAGFRSCEVLPIENTFFRFYRLER